MSNDDFLDSTLEVTIATDRRVLFGAGLTPGDAILLVLSGARVGHRTVLGAEACTIGRGSAATLQLEDNALSRLHARIELRGDAHYLVDAGSTNGSFVNYTRVQERRLEDGDLIQIGHVLCKYLSDDIETAYHEEFRRLVRRDALTGALNRATFDEELRSALGVAERTKKPVCLVLFDLDHFKRINDTRGHTAGDWVLSTIGKAVDELVQEPHLFARVGGEEFAVLYFGPLAEARAFGESLRATIEAVNVLYEGEPIPVTTSVGVAPWNGGVAGLMYQAADRALYVSKEGGRNRVSVDEGAA